VPQFGPSGPGGSFGFGTVLVWLGVVGLAVLVLWQVWSRFGAGRAAARILGGWRLGAWPVDPAHVATREELIQAFEYLSLLRLGAAARTWNHLDIAAALGAMAAGGSAARRAAARLAALYEEARYAPEEGPLPGPALAEARRDLCFLGGVAAA
jgi:hypothetical protein